MLEKKGFPSLIMADPNPLFFLQIGWTDVLRQRDNEFIDLKSGLLFFNYLISFRKYDNLLVQSITTSK